MKIVLRHRVTGRYFSGAGSWVRRADNAMTFEDVSSARFYARAHNIDRAAVPVPRLAPYMMGLLRNPQPAVWQSWTERGHASWYVERLSKFSSN